MRELFTSATCEAGCGSFTVPVPRFYGFWSVYAGTPKFLSGDAGSPEDRFALSDCVVGVKDATIAVVQVFKNTTWDSTVGKTMTLPEYDFARLAIHLEPSTEDLYRAGFGLMACLVRP